MKQVFFAFLAIILVSSMVFAQSNETAKENTTEPTPEPKLVCSASQCDKGCVKCSDKKCHESEFKCVEDINIDKFFPVEVQLGITQLNFALKNTGNVDLDDIFVVVTGDGLSTLDKIPLTDLAAGDKDYVFAKINATKTGIIDIVVKLYVGGNIKNKFVEQIKVLEPPKIMEAAPKINSTQLSNTLEQLKQTYKELEAEYQTKKQGGYPVDIIYDKLREAYSHITETQVALVEPDYKKVQSNLIILDSELKDIKEQLDSAKKTEATMTEKIKGNLLVIGSLAAAFISILTAYKLIQGSVNKQKLLEVHQRLKSLRKKKAGKKRKK